MLRLVTRIFSYSLVRVSERVGKVYCSHLEGLDLPPLESAIAENKVIGNTGEGGKEYWKESEGSLSEREI